MPLSTRLARRRQFKRPGFAPHALTFGPDGLAETFDVEVVLGGPLDPASGMIRDVAEVDRVLARVLDDYALVSRPAETLEGLAHALFARLENLFAPARLERLRLGRGSEVWVDVWP